MADGFNLETSGFDQTAKMLDELSDRDARLSINGALRVAARDAAARVAPHAPIREVEPGHQAVKRDSGKFRFPGNLRRSIRAYRLKRNRGDQQRWRIGALRRAFYHVMVEGGTKRGARPHPWMGRAWAQEAQQTVRVFETKLSQNVGRWLRRETNKRNPKKDTRRG